MSNIIACALLTSSLRVAWAAIRVGSVGQEWAMKTEWPHAIVQKLSRILAESGESLEAMVDHAATRRGLLEEVLERVAHCQEQQGLSA